jgi:ComF family protein
MLYHYKEALIRLFYPAACEVCHADLDIEESILCQKCAQDLDALAWPMEKALVDERFEHLDHVWTVYAYESPIKELLHGVKYARKDYLLKACRDRAFRLARAITSECFYNAVIPIPIDRLKLVQRHFNQAEIFAEILRSRLMPPVRRSFLIKRRPIPSQTSLTQHERAINVYGAFKLRRPDKVRNKSFLLLDDVLTTGATANEAARILKLHGAGRIDLLALARTISPEKKGEILSAAPQEPWKHEDP